MSPLIEFLIDVVASGLGGARKPRAPFPEGDANASLGAVAAFAGVLATIFAFALLGITSYGAAPYATDYGSLIGASLIVAIVAYGGRWAGLRAQSVTTRNLGLARFGCVVATVALAMSVASVVVGAVHLLR